VLKNLWLKAAFNTGPYRSLEKAGDLRKTWREEGSILTDRNGAKGTARSPLASERPANK
jgi:hypothetical protein